MLIRLIYLSKATVELSGTRLAELRAQSLARNRSAEVTGLLLHDGRRFIQALEGEERDVRRIMSRVERDARHTDIKIITDESAETRQFGDWSMEARSGRDRQGGAEFLARVKQDVEGVRDPAIQAAFIGFALLGGRTGAGPDLIH